MSDRYSVVLRWMDDRATLYSQSSSFSTKEEAIEEGKDLVASMGRGVAFVFKSDTWDKVATITVPLAVNEIDEVKMELLNND